MKKLLLAFLLIASSSFAQTSTSGGGLVSQQSTRLDACTPINAQAASGSQTTLTIPAPTTGQFIYISEIDYQYVVGTALGAAVAPTNTTTTNLGGLKWGLTLPVTANTNYTYAFHYPTGLKAAASATAVTIVGIAGTANLTQTINACYWYGN